jgi:gluconate kinase
MGETWLVTGIPGSGKSTVAHKLASEFDRGVYISGDHLHDMIVGGQLEPDGEPRDEAERQVGLIQRNCCLLAQSFSEASFVPVIDWVVRHRRDLTAFLQGLSRCTVYLVVLAPTLSIVQQRKPDAYRRWAYLQEDMTRDMRDVGLWVDPGDLTPEQIVESILANKVGAELQ